MKKTETEELKKYLDVTTSLTYLPTVNPEIRGRAFINKHHFLKIVKEGSEKFGLEVIIEK